MSEVKSLVDTGYGITPRGTTVDPELESSSDSLPGPATCFVSVLVGLLIFGIIIVAYRTQRHIKESREKAKDEGPITRAPGIPFPQKDLQLFTDYGNIIYEIPEVRFHVETGNKEYHGWNLVLYMDKVVIDLFKVNGKRRNYVPPRSKVISIKMEGFNHGKKCHEFVPIRGATLDSYFQYQMFGEDRIQATFYVENKVSYIAGFCIYIEDPNDLKEHYDMERIKGFFNGLKLTSANTIPDVTEQLSEQITLSRDWAQYQTSRNTDPEEEKHFRYCPKTKTNLITKICSEVVMHQEWDERQQKMIETKCDVCVPEDIEDSPPPYASITIV